MNALQAFDLPTSRDENWKYANLKPLAKVRFEAAAQAADIALDALPAPIDGYARYVFVDGHLASALSSTATPSGVTVEFPKLSASQSIVPAAKSRDLRFAALNESHATQGVRIATAAGAERTGCIELVFVATADAQTASSYPHIEVATGERGRLILIERHVSLGSDNNFIDSAVRMEIASGARVEHYRLQEAGPKSTWIDTLSAHVARDAAYQIYLLNLGALSARSTMSIELAGERAELALHCASLADRQQVHDAFAQVEHAAPATHSRQTFRGIAAGRARAAFNSKVVVRDRARGADSYQSLRGLLAGPDAEIDVRPQLEIHTDEVRCAHGATAGKLDDAMLFYLLSRGLEPQTAQRLLKWAFLEDVVAKIAVPQLRAQIEQGLAGQFL